MSPRLLTAPHTRSAPSRTGSVRESRCDASRACPLLQTLTHTDAEARSAAGSPRHSPGPALGGLFFPAFLLSVLSALYTATLASRSFLSDGPGSGKELASEHTTGRPVVFFMLAMVGVLCCLLWAILFRVRYVAHVYPPMLIIILFEASRLRGLASEMGL